jgi:allantoinase
MMIVQNGQVALPGEEHLCEVDLRVEEGRIAEIGPDLTGEGEILDVEGLYVLPGGIDPHVHLDDPGYTHREDFNHGTCAAASGGITTVIDMPCTSVPPVTNEAHLRAKLDQIRHKPVVDFGLYGGVSAQSWDMWGGQAMEGLAEHVLGFKVYAISGMESFGRLDPYRFEQVLAQSVRLERPVLLHAEDYEYVSAATAIERKAGDGPLHYYRSRPEIAELLAVSTAISLAEATGADLHIVHIGTARAAELLAKSRVTGETAPHYLAFSFDDFERMGSRLKTTPPVKPEANRDRLWELLADGTIDFVASDHAPCPAEEKATGSIWTDYAGMPGSGTMLPFLFSEGYLTGRITLRRLVEATSERAAERYGISHRKGSIALGKDADFCLMDPDGTWTVRGEAFYSKGKITPFEGMTLQGRVVKTLVRGRVVYDAREGIVVPGGYGVMLRRGSRGIA